MENNIHQYGLLSVLTEVNVYLRGKNPDIMGLVKAKLCGQEMVNKTGQGKYTLWQKNRSGKGLRVIVTVKKI